jgi:propanol-preferring alcohol dehydrogenase
LTFWHTTEDDVAMRAMVMDGPGLALREVDLPGPELAPGQVRIRVHACGVCRTDLHVRDGELRHPKLPLVLGHEIVGIVVEGASEIGSRVGVPWLGWTCGECRYCHSGRENLCDRALFTGYTLDGGYAEEVVADARYCFALPDGPSDAELAPLLCAGLIGYRSLRLAGDAARLGLYGFGAAAHIVAQLACGEGRRVFAFTRRGDEAAQSLARELGAEWAGIHMSPIPSFPYELLWGERTVRSVANLTRRDGEEFFRVIATQPVETTVEVFQLAAAEDALSRLRRGAVRGAAVLSMR